MSKLTKIVAATAVIATAGYAGASWWMGQQAEHHTDQALNWVKDKLGEHAVVQSNYQRGLFSDENTIVVELKRPPKAAQSAAAKAGEGHESQAESSRESQADSSRWVVCLRCRCGVGGDCSGGASRGGVRGVSRTGGVFLPVSR